MKKRRYQTTNVKQVNWNKIVNHTQDQHIVCGVDVAKEDQDPVIALWYQHKVKRDGGIKRKAILALMRKLAMALWYVARGEAFDSHKLFNAQALGLAA